LTEAARGRAQLPIDVTMDVLSPPPPEVKIAFYYVAQEALNNVAKHARARKVAVQLHSSHDSAALSVSDDGQGFEIGQVTPEHLGLAIMRERSEAINGRLEIQSQPGAGTTVTIRWQSQESDDRP
jgi:signal transduction histidine kinase